MKLLKYLQKTKNLSQDPLINDYSDEIFSLIDISDTKVSNSILKQIYSLRKNFQKTKKNLKETPLSIIIPYRDRESHLIKFIPAISEKLKDTEFEILVIEQKNNYPFNIGLLRNFGALIAKYDQLVHHDIDFLPLDAYYSGCNHPLRLLTKIKKNDDDFIPNSVEASDDKERVKNSYFSGVISISKYQYLLANGFPNNYFGWGEEDNEFLLRCIKIGLTPLFHKHGEFIALPHVSNGDNEHGDKDSKIKKKLRVRNGDLYRKSRKGVTDYWESGMNNIQDLTKIIKQEYKYIDKFKYNHICIDFNFTQ